MGMNFGNSANSTLLDNMFKDTTENKNALVTKDVSLELIDANPDNDKIFNMRNIDHLADIIKNDTFVGAIDVFQKKDGRYEIIAGHRRYLAVKKLGYESIKCNIMPEPDERVKAKRLIFSNLGSRDLGPMDYARSIMYYKVHVIKEDKKNGIKYSNSRAELAKVFHVSEGKVQLYLDLLKLIPELQELADNPDFPYSRLRAVANMPEEDQREIYKQITQIYDEFGSEEKTITAERLVDITTAVRHRRDLQEKYRHLNELKEAKKLEEDRQTSDDIMEPEVKQEGEKIPEPVLKNEPKMPTDTTYRSTEELDNSITHEEDQMRPADDEIKVQAYRLINTLKHSKIFKDFDDVVNVLDDLKTQINIFKEQ